jgi:hypothetical protein
MERSKEWLPLKELQAKQRAIRLEEARQKAAKARDARLVRQQREICRRVSLGQSMLTILTEGDRSLPKYETALEWLTDYPDFADAYSKAQRARSDVLFEEALTISDDARNDWMSRNDPNNAGFMLNGENINRSKLRVETRKWAAAKLNPSRYGEKTTVETSDKPIVVAVTHRIVQVVRQETLQSASLTIDEKDENDPKPVAPV